MKSKIVVSVVLFAVSFIIDKFAEKLFPFKELVNLMFSAKNA